MFGAIEAEVRLFPGPIAVPPIWAEVTSQGDPVPSGKVPSSITVPYPIGHRQETVQLVRTSHREFRISLPLGVGRRLVVVLTRTAWGSVQIRLIPSMPALTIPVWDMARRLQQALLTRGVSVGIRLEKSSSHVHRRGGHG